METVMEKSYDNRINVFDNEWALLPQPATRPALNGIIWLLRAARLFGQHWLRWLGLGAFITLCQVVMWIASHHMTILFFFVPLLMLMFCAGMLNAASVQDFDRDPPHFSHLFTTLESGSNYVHLLVFYLLLLSAIVLTGYGAGAYLLNQYRQDPAGLTLPLASAAVAWVLLWFAPALVFLQSENPVRAIYLSIKASLKNLLPMLLMMTVQLLLASGTAMLMFWWRSAHTEPTLLLKAAAIGAWVFFQVFGLLCCYTSYRDIWFEHVRQNAPSTRAATPSAAIPQPATPPQTAAISAPDATLDEPAPMPEPTAIPQPTKINPTKSRGKRRAKKR